MVKRGILLAAVAFSFLGIGPARAADLIEDNSLTPDQYKSLGFPDVARVWTLDDLKAAGKAFDLMNKDDPTKFPRAGSAKSGPVFARLISLDALNAIKRKPDQAQRITDLTAAYLLLTAIARPYLVPPKDKYFDAETTLLTGVASKYSAAVVHELASLRSPGDDAQFEQMCIGLAKQYSVSLKLLGPGTNLSMASREQLLKDMSTVLPDVMPILTPAIDAALVKVGQQLVDGEKDAGFKAKLQTLLDTMNKVAKK